MLVPAFALRLASRTTVEPTYLVNILCRFKFQIISMGMSGVLIGVVYGQTVCEV